MSSEVSTQAEPGPSAQAPFTLQLLPAEPGSRQPKRYLWKAPSGIEGLKDEVMPHGDEEGLHAYIFVNTSYIPTYPKGFRYKSNCPEGTHNGLGSLATKLSEFVAAHEEFLEETSKLASVDGRRHKLQRWLRDNVKSASEKSIWLIDGSLNRIAGFKDDPRELFKPAPPPSSLEDEPGPAPRDLSRHEGVAASGAGYQSQSSIADFIKQSASLFLGTYGADPFGQIPRTMWAKAHRSVKQLPNQIGDTDRETLGRVLTSLRSRRFPSANEAEFMTLGMGSPSHQAAFLKVMPWRDGGWQTMPTTAPSQAQREQEHGSSGIGSDSRPRDPASGNVQPSARDAPGHDWATQSATGLANDPDLFQGPRFRNDSSGPAESHDSSSGRKATSWRPGEVVKIFELSEDQLDKWVEEGPSSSS